MLRANTALRIFKNGTTCEVDVPSWVGIDSETYTEWEQEFLENFQERSVGHGSTGGFTIVVRPGEPS